MSDLPCPTCGGELAFLDQYERHYCYSCGLYAPEGFGDRGAQRCPTCTGILSFIRAYERFYCYRCSDYPPEGVFAESHPPSASGSVESTTTLNEATLVVLEPESTEQRAHPREAASVPVEQGTRDEEGSPPDEAVPGVVGRPLIREEIEQAKKPLLLELCKSHGLDPTGSKEALRERLLGYLDDLERESRPPQIEEIAEEVSGTATEEQPKPTDADRPEDVPLEAPAEVKPEQPVPSSVPTTPWSFDAPTPRQAAGPPMATALEPVSVAASPTHAEEAASPVQIPEQESTARTPGVQISKVEHPCPSCRRELTYISQYDRWYCYSCRAYAPRRKAKFACPNCGAALRWISPYARWWCDSCRRYAPAELPKPEGALSVSIAGRAARPTASVSTVHRHRSPGSGISLVGFGLLLFVVYEVFIDLPIALAMDTGFVVSPDVAFGLRFFAFLFVAAGAIIGLSAVRDER